jgi:hypothetical protein
MTTTPTLTDADRKAARAAAEADRRRRVKAVDDACARAGVSSRYADLTKDQRARALTPPDDASAGLLAEWILDGAEAPLTPAPAVAPAAPKSPAPAEAPAETDAERLARLVEKGDKSGFSHSEAAEVQRLRAALAPDADPQGDAPAGKPRARHAADPAAHDLAARASALAADVKSGWTPRQARMFLDGTTVARDERGLVVVRRGESYHELSVDQLRRFGVGGEKRASPSSLGPPRAPRLASTRTRWINAAVRRLRVFTVRRFADAVGATTRPPSTRTCTGSGTPARSARSRAGDRRVGRYYVAADYHGPHSVAIAQGDEPVPEEAKPAPPEVSAGESRMLERTRDFVAQQRTSFTPLAVAEALGIDKGAATALLDQLAARDVGGWVDDDHTQYRYERPTDPGPGARFNADGPGDETRRVGGNGQPVPGTGAGAVLSPNKEVAQLVARMEAAGGVARKTDGGHIEVTAPSGQRIVMASTPSKPAMSETRAQARRAGLDV